MENTIAISDAEMRLAVVQGAYVTDDAAAVRAFLRQLETSPMATERAFKKEVKRFLVWLLHTGHSPGSALAGLGVLDMEEYFRFLRSPAPLAKEPGEGTRGGYWKGPAPLGQASLEHSKTLLSSFFDKLCDYEHSPGRAFRTTNPVRAIGRVVAAPRAARQPGERAPVASEEDSEHVLSPEDIALVLATIESAPRETPRQAAHYQRNRWVILLAYHSFLRISELARLQMGDFELSKSGDWQVYIHPSKHERKGVLIDASPPLMTALTDYRRSLRKMPFPFRGEPGPAIMPVVNKNVPVAPVRTLLHTGAWRTEEQPSVIKPLTDRAIFDIIKGCFRLAAEGASSGEQRARLLAASPHWLRHSGITDALNRGVDPRYVSAQARHQGLQTTLQTYDHGLSMDAKRRELAKLR